MNRTYRSVRNDKRENFALKGLAVSLMLAFASNIYALPVGGAVSAGSASIAGGAGTMTVNQSSQNAAINWQSFSIGQTEAVRFVQPNSSAVALNRVLGPDPSSIFGSLTANGKVFLVNPGGILFGPGAQVNVGGLVASTRNITDGDFMAGNYRFAGAGGGTVVNQGSINAEGGYVALLGASVSNEGVITARLGTVALAAGDAFTLDVAGDGLLNVAVNQGAFDALAANGGVIRADGGQVLLTALSAGNLLQSAVNNTGIVQAQTVENHNGTIRLLGDMQSGTVNVAGTLDASAPHGGNGGFIEASAAHVSIVDNAQISTLAPAGLTGTFLIDPQDFTIGIGGNILGATLSALLVTNSVVITTNTGPDATVAGTPPVTTLNTATLGNGDIFVNQAVTWTAAPSTTTLTLNAARDVNVNSAITATNGNLVVCCGRDVNANAAITTVNGSVLLAAGRDANLNAAMTTTDGNLLVCAGQNVNVGALGALTLTRGSTIPAQSLASLGVPLGFTLSAGNAATGPGAAGGTVIFAPLTPPATVTGPNAPATINYNPVSYTTPTNYLPNFTLTLGATLTQNMLVFPGGADKVADGTTTAIFTTLQGNPPGVTLGGPGIANFANVGPGVDIPVTYTGVTLGGATAGFALPTGCCGVITRTTGTITAAPVVVAPGIVPPVVVAVPGDELPFAPIALAALPVFQNTVGAVFARGTGLDISVLDEGIRMPPVVVAKPAPVPPPPVYVPPPPPVYVPPVLPRRPDRN